MNATINQTLIETVEQDAQEALVNFLQEVKAPALVGQLIQDLRLLDQVESQKEWVLGEAGRNAELVPILNRLTAATYAVKVDTITRD